ncbi:hypothetical protein BpHYR1_005598 [Brachionus plicatilis]|uniref:Uncharacterized protein n=1 Tax=Brachionus plicatilis TaxID=10195 RepID=A0A3M7P4P5_BRAPC|nr:hypothetical protein BpHYR1_005598 [Brachionus plicatilis]
MFQTSKQMMVLFFEQIAHFGVRVGFDESVGSSVGVGDGVGDGVGGDVLFSFSFGNDKSVAHGAAFFLNFHFVCSLTLVIDATKIGHNYRHWQSDDEHARQRTNAANYFSHGCFGHHVTVAKRCHGNNGVPKCGWYAREF